MAKRKNTWIKYLVALAVVIVLLLVSMLKNRQYRQESSPVLDLKKEDITALSIFSSKDTVQIRQLNDTTWTAVEPDTGDIDENKVDRLLTGLIEAKQTGIATEKPDNYSVYNVDESSTLVELSKGETLLASFYLGRSTSSYSQGYLRFKDEDKVYRINKNLSYMANSSPTYWQKK